MASELRCACDLFAGRLVGSQSVASALWTEGQMSATCGAQRTVALACEYQFSLCISIWSAGQGRTKAEAEVEVEAEGLTSLSRWKDQEPKRTGWKNELTRRRTYKRHDLKGDRRQAHDLDLQ